MSSSRRRNNFFDHHAVTNEHNSAHTEQLILANTKLDTIATNTANIHIDVESVNLNVDTLEALQTSTKNALFENPAGTGLTIGETNAAQNLNIIAGNAKLDTINTSIQELVGHNDGVETALIALDTAQDLTNSKLDSVINNTSPINDAELHLSAIDTNIVNMGNNIATMKIFNQDAELHLSALDTNISARLPTTIGPKDEALSLTIARNNTVGAFDSFARTDITDRATSKALLCDSGGRQKVSMGITSDAVVNHISSQAVGAGSTHTGASIAVDPGTRNFIVVHDFTSVDLTYSIEASLDNSTFVDTQLVFNAGGGMGGSAVQVGLNTFMGLSSTGGLGFTPFIRFKFSNATGGAITINSFKYMIQNN
jgi:hypothetical protein